MSVSLTAVVVCCVVLCYFVQFTVYVGQGGGVAGSTPGAGGLGYTNGGWGGLRGVGPGSGAGGGGSSAILKNGVVQVLAAGGAGAGYNTNSYGGAAGCSASAAAQNGKTNNDINDGCSGKGGSISAAGAGGQGTDTAAYGVAGDTASIGAGGDGGPNRGGGGGGAGYRGGGGGCGNTVISIISYMGGGGGGASFPGGTGCTTSNAGTVPLSCIRSPPHHDTTTGISCVILSYVVYVARCTL